MANFKSNVADKISNPKERNKMINSWEDEWNITPWQAFKLYIKKIFRK